MSFLYKRKNEVAVILDIGNGSIGGGISLLSSSRPAVLYGTRINIPFQEEVRGQRLISLMLQSLSQTVHRLLHEGFEASGFSVPMPKIKEVFVILSAPWEISRTSILRLSNKDPILITEKIVPRLLLEQENEKPAIKEGKQIEQKLIKAELNGYETSKPFGKRASEVSLAILSGFAQETVISQITDVVSHEFHSSRISFHSFSFSAVAAIREIFPEQKSFFHIDASSEQTELSIVKRGVLLETSTFPYGRNHFIREIQRSIKASGSSAETLFVDASEKKGTGALYERARKALEKAIEEWLVHFSSALSSFSEEIFLPQTVFVTAESDMCALLQDTIDHADFSRFSLVLKSFQSICVASDLLSPFLQQNFKSKPDPFLCLEAISCNILRNDSADVLLRK